MADETITLHLTQYEARTIKDALRLAHASHVRNDFGALALSVEILQSKVMDAMIDAVKVHS
jgi:hypothetical protein